MGVITKAIDLAIRHLSQRIEDTVREGGTTRVPSLEILAKGAGVSRHTMWCAAQSLKRSGTLVSRCRGDLSIAGVIGHDDRGSTKLWQKRRILVERDMAAGRFGAANLIPGITTLARQYSTSYATMKKVADALIADRIIVPAARGFRFCTPGASTVGVTIPVLTESPPETGSSLYNERLRRLIAPLENNGYRVEFHYYDPWVQNSDDVAARLDRLKNKTIGVVLNLWWTGEPEAQPGVVPLIRRICSAGRPVAVFDANGNFNPDQKALGRGTMKVFHVSDRKAGLVLGRFLTSRRNRNIAFFSLDQKYEYVRRRLEGLQEAFRLHDTGAKIRPWFPPAESDPFWRVVRAWRISADQASLIFTRVYTDSEVETIAGEYREKTAAAPSIDAPLAAEGARYLLAMARRGVPESLYRRSFFWLMEETSREVAGTMLEPLFEEALRDHDVTAWIGANDQTALCAAEYLWKKRGSRHDVLVAGFDNSTQAFASQLASVDLVPPQAAWDMVRFFRDAPGLRGNHRILHQELECMVIDRGMAVRAGFIG